MPGELAGKTVEFTLKVKEIKEKELPPLTDKWSSEISEFPTLLELRQEIRSKIQEGKERAAEQRFTAMALQAATDNAEVDLPDVVVRGQAEEMLADFRRSLESQGGTLDGYVDATGVSVEQILEEMKPQAANNVKTSLMLDAVAKAEGLEADDEEVTAMIGQMAAATRSDAKSLESRLRKSGRIEALREQIVRDKAVEFITKNAEAEEPPLIDFAASVEAFKEEVAAAEAAAGESESETPAEPEASAAAEDVEAVAEAENVTEDS